MSGPKSLLAMMDEKAGNIREAKGLPAVPIQQPVFTDKDKQSMEVVFNQLMQIFPGHRKQFKTDDEFSRFKAQFIKGLLDSKIRRREQFEKAFRKARERIFPTLPTIGEFLSWCKREPEDYGYLSAKQALWEVVNHYRDISPAAMLAGRKTRYERGSMSSDKYADLFESTYTDIVFNAVDNGINLAEQVQRSIEHKEPEKYVPGKLGQSTLDELKKMLGRKPDKKIVNCQNDDPEFAEIERRLRVINKRRKLGFSVCKEDLKFEECHRNVNPGYTEQKTGNVH